LPSLVQLWPTRPTRTWACHHPVFPSSTLFLFCI
jgi:hypothetical protein